MAKNPIRGSAWPPAALTRLSSGAARGASPSGESTAEWRMLSALCRVPEGSVAAALDQWLREGRRATVPQLMKHVRELRKRRHHRRALEVMDWMKVQGMHMPISGNAVCLDLIAKVKGIGSAEEYFSILPEPAKHMSTYGTLFFCYCSMKMEEKGIALFKRMEDLNLVASVLVYNNLMTLYMKLGQFEEVANVFKKMKASNVIPDICTFRILIKSYALVDDITSVERVAQEMEASRGALDWFTYCHLASIYNSAGLYEKAQISLKKAELVMGYQDLSPFPVLINLYARAGNLSEVKRVWELLKTRIARPANRNFLIMLKALNELDDIDALKQCFAEWETCCVNFDIRLVKVVIDAFLRKDMVEDANLLVEKAAGKGDWTDLEMLTLLVDYYLRTHKMELSQKCSQMATYMIKQGQTQVEAEDQNAELLQCVKVLNDTCRKESYEQCI